MECFQKNPTLRISAKRLLKHPWIQSAKRTVPVVSAKPTEYTEAVKSVQEWNEALKSPGSLRKSARSSTSSRTSPPSTAVDPAARKTSLNMNVHIPPKHRVTAESFRSPEVDADDNWDDDFAESITPGALHLPHLQPQDNFAGLFSKDRLKAFASFESVAEEPYNFDAEATVKSPVDLRQYLRQGMGSFDEPETVRSSSIRVKPSSSRNVSGATSDDRHDGPKTAFLRGVPKSSQLSKTSSMCPFQSSLPAIKCAEARESVGQKLNKN